MDKVKQRAQLYNLNLIAGFLHGINFLTALGLASAFSKQGVQGHLTTDFNGNVVNLGSYSLIWVDVPFPFITACFHFYLALFPDSQTNYWTDVSVLNKNHHRWREYSITASLMTWVLMQLAGITNVITLVSLAVVANVALQMMGHLMETLNPPKQKQVNWLPTVIGWLICSCQWAYITSYFVNRMPAPWYVWVAILGMAIQFSIFGFIQLFFYLGWTKTYYQVELSYIFMSFTAKVYLTLTLVIAMIIGV